MEGAAPTLKLYTLGSPQVYLDETPVRLPRRKTLALLVYLLVTRQSHQRAALAALLWPDHETPRAYAYLRQALWEINQAFGAGWIEADRDQAGLAADAAAWVDVWAFREALEAAEKHPHPSFQPCEACMRDLEKAAGFYQGEFLNGFGLPDAPEFDDWEFYQAETFRRALQGALQLLSNGWEVLGDFPAAIEAARRWLEMDDLNEAAHRRLMILYARSGERKAAVTQYQACVEVLDAALGIQPAPETTALYEKILRGEAALSPETPGSPLPILETRPPPAAKTILPSPTTSFIGRTDDLARIASLLQDPNCRIITVVGPGGIGKTRLALETTARQETVFPDGVYFFPLAHIQTGHGLATTLVERFSTIRTAHSAEDQDKAGLIDELVVQLKEYNALIVLDNFEQLVSEANLLSELAEKAPGLKFLVTSRVALNLSGEWVYELSGLAYPGSAPESLIEWEGFGAVQLFLERARQAQVGFLPAEADWKAIAQITRLVGGMPLALELAASWVSVLKVDEIAAEIQRDLDLLATDLQDVPDRQRSIRAVFDYSWQLLNPKEQNVIAVLSIFQKGFSREAALKITGIALPELLGLVKKSLIRATPENRFDMHPLLRQYAAERLAANSEQYQTAHQRHSTYYCQALKAWGEQMATPMQEQVFRHFEWEYENMLQAWHWAAANRQSQLLANAVYGICWAFLLQSRHVDGEAAIRAAWEATNPRVSLIERQVGAHLLYWYALFSMMCGHIERAFQLMADLEHYLDHVDLDPTTLLFVKADALFLRADAEMVGSFEKSFELTQQSLELYRKANRPFEASHALINLAWLAGLTNRQEEAEVFRTEALAIKRAIGDQFGLANDLVTTGVQYAFNQGRIMEAIPLLQQALQIFGTMGGKRSMQAALETSDHLYIIQGDFQKARNIREKHLQVLETIGYPPHVGFCKAQMGEVYHHLGDYTQAQVYGTQALTHFKGYELWFNAGFSEWFLGLTLLALEDYPQAQARFQNVIATSPGNQPENIGSAEAGVARAVYAMGEFDYAWELSWSSLEKLYSPPHFFWLFYALSSAALLLAHRGEPETALEVYSMVHKYDFVANSRWFADVYTSPITSLTAHLPAEVRAAAWQRGQELALYTHAGELLKRFKK